MKVKNIFYLSLILGMFSILTSCAEVATTPNPFKPNSLKYSEYNICIMSAKNDTQFMYSSEMNTHIEPLLARGCQCTVEDPRMQELMREAIVKGFTPALQEKKHKIMKDIVKNCLSQKLQD
jgi:hypothetical protein